MALATATVTMNLSDMLGTDFDTRRTKVWVSTNVPGDTVIDTVGNAIRLGTGTVTLNTDGTASVAVWKPGTGSNPASWQTYIHVDYPDAGTRTRVVRDFGPFTLTADADLADLVAEQEVPPTFVGQAIAQIQALVDQAETITGLTGEDDAVALLVGDTGSDTRAALDTLYGGGGGGVGISGRGFNIPAGSLDTWYAARDNAANELVEIAIYGDSTTYGSCFDAAGGVYSWTQKLRALIAAAGLPNGGRGVVSINDTAAVSPDGYSGIFANTGFGSVDNQGPLLTDTAQNSTSGNAITFKGKGTAIRLLYGIRDTSGGFSYSVDGGTAVNVEPVVPTDGFGGDAVLVSGLSDGDHTVTITNLGGSIVVGPAAISDQGGTTGTIPAGNYYYRATYTTGSGETALGSGVVGPISIGANTGRTLFVNASGYTNVKLYRSTNASTGFQLVATTAAVQNTFIVDSGAAPGAAPPSTSTAGRLSTNKYVSVSPQFLRATGVVVNKYGVSGITTGNYFFPMPSAPGGSWQARLTLGQYPGLDHGAGQSDPNTMKFSWAQPEGTHPKYPRVRLAVCALGINDMQGSADISAATTNVRSLTNNLTVFVRSARSAGADPLIVIPHLNLAQGGDNFGGMFQTAIQQVATAYSVPWVDFNEAIGPMGSLTANGQIAAVHAAIATYDREAKFLWDNALSAGLDSGL